MPYATFAILSKTPNKQKPKLIHVDDQELLLHSIGVNHDKILKDVMDIERRSFPKSESMGIIHELGKALNTCLVALIDDKVASYIIYSLSSGLITTVRILKVCTVSRYQRRGLASTLIRMALARTAFASQDVIVELHVDTSRIAAIECYSKLGFMKEGDVLQDYYGPTRDAWLMRLHKRSRTSKDLED